MSLTLIGTNHHYASIDVREQLATSPAHLAERLSELARASGVRELALLSTCNRTEIYASDPKLSPEELANALVSGLSEVHRIPRSRFDSLMYARFNRDAAHHLFRVVSGLDSIAIGEAQILGQTREAFRVAQANGYTGSLLSGLFQQALNVGKRIQSETGLGKGEFSIGHAAAELAGKVFEDLSQARILILGAGKMSELTAQQLTKTGAKSVFVANRTYERAVELAEQLGGSAIHYDKFSDYLVTCDILVASTAAPHTILNKSDIAPVMRKRRGKPLFLVDIALPRDIDPDVSELDNVYLYNIDSLQQIVADQSRARAVEIEAAERLALEEAGEFQKWRRDRDAAPVIAAVKQKLDAIREEDLALLKSRLPHLSEKDFSAVEIAMRAMMNHVSREAILALKAEASGEQTGPEAGYTLQEAAQTLFGASISTERAEEKSR